MRTFHGVQAMRGIAALAVVCAHAIVARSDFVSHSADVGAQILTSGVDIFFVISGFIIATTAASQTDVLNFAFRRAIRIYPMYWLVLLAAFVSSYWIATGPGDRVALDLSRVFAWDCPNWYVPPAWTLTLEMHFYAVVAVILAIAPGRLFELLFWAFGIAVVAIIFHLPLGLFSHPLMLEFGAGVFIAHLVRTKGTLPFFPYAMAMSVALFAAGWYWMFVHGSSNQEAARVPTFGLGAALLIYAVVSAELHGASFSRVLQWFGSISYSLYISHSLLISWIASFTELWQISPAGVIVASILLSIGLAAVLHLLVEVPTLKWGRKLSLARGGGEVPPTLSVAGDLRKP